MKDHKVLGKYLFDVNNDIKTKLAETEDNLMSYLNEYIESLVIKNKESQIFDLENMFDSKFISSKKQSM